MTQQFELIVFDWDGTLMDSAARIVESLRAAGSDAGLHVLADDVLRNVIGLGMREAVLTLHPDLSPAEIDFFSDRYRHHYLVSCPMPSKLFEGVRPILEDLIQHDLLLAVATGKSRAGLARVLAETDCQSYFHATRTADVTCSKPDPQMLMEIIEVLGVSPDKTLMVGDTEYDLDMAQRAGVASVAVSYGAHESHRLIQYPALAQIDSLPGLHQWLRANVMGSL